MPRYPDRHGVVAATNRDPLGCVSVLWDGNTFPYTLHSSFVEHVAVSKASLRWHSMTADQRAVHNLKARLRRYRTYDDRLLRRLARESKCREARIVLAERAVETPA